MRARVKDAADLPERVLCCAEARVVSGRSAGQVVELRTPAVVRRYLCIYCGFTGLQAAYYLADRNDRVAWTDCIDIEEGT